MFVVSDDILERLICSQCKKYLSVKNIKVYPNRGIKCGRCSKTGDAGVVSLFGVLADEALFRCVNRFEGCNQLLYYSDVADHEETCVGKEYECPCCVLQFKGSAYEIYIHFKELHTDLLLVNTPEFVLEIDNEMVKSYLYRKNDLLFFINARYSRGEEELILNVMFFGNNLDASNISQMFTLHSLDRKLRYKTKRKNGCSSNEGNLKCFRIDLSSTNFSKNVVLCRFHLNTENVENLVALPEIIKKSKQDFKDHAEASGIIRRSAFGKETYPVEIFNPFSTNGNIGKGIYPVETLRSASTSGNMPGIKPAFTTVSSATVANSFFGPAFSTNRTNTTPSSVFTKHNLKPSPSNQPVPTTVSPFQSSTSSPFAGFAGPISTTSSIFVKPDSYLFSQSNSGTSPFTFNSNSTGLLGSDLNAATKQKQNGFMTLRSKKN